MLHMNQQMPIDSYLHRRINPISTAVIAFNRNLMKPSFFMEFQSCGKLFLTKNIFFSRQQNGINQSRPATGFSVRIFLQIAEKKHHFLIANHHHVILGNRLSLAVKFRSFQIPENIERFTFESAHWRNTHFVWGLGFHGEEQFPWRRTKEWLFSR